MKIKWPFCLFGKRVSRLDDTPNHGRRSSLGEPEIHSNSTTSLGNCSPDALHVKPSFCSSDSNHDGKEELKCHIKAIHDGNVPLNCSPCGKNFKIEKDLSNHISSVHEESKSVDCDTCDKNFSKKCELKNHVHSIHGRTTKLNVIAVNVCGNECNSRLEEIRLLLVKYNVDIAILSETETSHAYAPTTNIDGFKSFCPPKYVTGPSGKEVGVIVLVSEKLASTCKIRPDINGSDTVQTVWIQFTNHDILIGGIYRRGRSLNNELEKLECVQLNSQILKAARSGMGVLLMGDTNMDHSNPNHRRKNEAKELLSIIEATNMRRLPTGPTCFRLHKVCSCKLKSLKTVCECPKRHKVSTIDNAFLSLSETGTIKVLDDSFSDHFPILATLTLQTKATGKNLKTTWRRDLSRLKISTLEDALQSKNCSQLFDLCDPNEAVTYLLERITEALDEEAPLKKVKFRPDKPELSLKRDTLTAMSSRDTARKNGNLELYQRLQNKTKSLVKLDKIQGVVTRLKENPGPQSAWKEAMTLLGRKRTSKLPECTSNSDPGETAEYQNQYFSNKIADLLSKLPTNSVEEKSFKCGICGKNFIMEKI